jgi:hypothetical protein
LGSEQSAGMVDHIESAASKMIVRICGVGLVHHLNGLYNNGLFPCKSAVCCVKFAR